MNIEEHSLEVHKKLKGKIKVALKDSLDSKLKLSTYYTPGVGAVSRYVSEHEDRARDYTWLNNNLAVISDGSAVLGLGNIGALGALPVMEGKCMLFKHFAGIDAVPIILNVHCADEIIQAVLAIAPSFSAINLEDIAAPICFEVEDQIKAKLNIPVMHDDQHGTAIVVLAGLINAASVVNKKLGSCRIVIIGAGAAGYAVAKLIHEYSKAEVTVADSKGVINKSRSGLNQQKQFLAGLTNQSGSSLRDVLKGADIVIGLSKGDMLKPADMKSMAKDPIVFAMANPNPEILPDVAKRAGAAVVATGRSDFPNQVNNVLAFPGIFRGALDHRVRHITEKHKVAAAEALANLVAKPTPDNIIPFVFNKKLVPAIAAVIN